MTQADLKHVVPEPNHQIGDIDWFAPTEFTPEEKEAILYWYSTYHGEGTADLSAFVPFWLDFNEQAFRRYRRWVLSAIGGGVPAAAGSLTYLHHYAIRGWQQGTLYEVILARECGVSKRQVLETLELAFLHAGPLGMTNTALSTRHYLHAWTDSQERDDIWPDGWSADPEAFRSGIDLTVPGLTPGEARQLKRWYEANQGEVPSYVDLLAEYNPEALKAFRNRYENVTTTLPKQLVPLYTYHTAAASGQESAMRRAMFQARRYGVTRDQLVRTMTKAMIYAGDLGMSQVAEVSRPLLDAWDEL